MKRKIFYLLVLICSLSVISSAKQADYNCSKKMSCVMEVKSGMQSPTPKEKTEMDFEFSPIRFLVMDI